MSTAVSALFHRVPVVAPGRIHTERKSQMAARVLRKRAGALAIPKSEITTTARPTTQVLVNCAPSYGRRKAEMKSQAPSTTLAIRGPALFMGRTSGAPTFARGPQERTGAGPR